MHLRDKLKQYQKEGKAILAANFYNLETLQGIVYAAHEMNSPVLLQLSKSSIDYMGLNSAVSMYKGMKKDIDVESWLHLDHAPSFDLVKRCLDVGFDSVMIDASEKSFDENIEISRQVVELAENYNAVVEAELGYVAKLGQSAQKKGFTNAAEAAGFVIETGVDMLAVAIGSAHGFYKETPNLDIERLAEIRKATKAVLVLHGSSGIPDTQIQAAIKNGITKINLATEIKNIFTKTVKEVLTESDEIDLRKTFPKAVRAVSRLIIGKLEVMRV